MAEGPELWTGGLEGSAGSRSFGNLEDACSSVLGSCYRVAVVSVHSRKAVLGKAFSNCGAAKDNEG